MTIAELMELSLAQLAEGYARRTISPVEVMNTTLAHAEKVNGAINALFSFHADEALAEARASQARWRDGKPLGLLDGVPMTIKDSVAFAGWPYHHGLKANADAPPSSYTSPPAMALTESGAPIFAKTTMPDCGLLAAGVSSLYGVTRNPWGLQWNTGGSSSGAGASVAAGVGFVTIGTDLAGSVRLPASHCGLASLKPSHGRVAHTPSDSMRMAGPMGRRVEDIARLLTVLTRQDERDTWSLPADSTQYHERLDRDMKGLRIGVLTDMGGGSQQPEPAVKQAVEYSARLLENAGAHVGAFVSPLDWGFYAPLDLFFQVRGLFEVSNIPEERRGGINGDLMAWAQKGSGHSGQDVMGALARIGRMKTALISAFEQFDYVIAPTMPVVNFPAEMSGVDPAMPLGHTIFTAPFNQTGQPAGTVNMAFDDRGLPIGVQIIGHRFDDLGVLQVAKFLEDHREIKMDWPVEPRG